MLAVYITRPTIMQNCFFPSSLLPVLTAVTHAGMTWLSLPRWQV